MKPKFRYGDLVRVADDLGPSMEHFTKGCNAIVVEAQGAEIPQYGLFLENRCESWWYYETQLTFIRRAPDLLESWKDQRDARIKNEGDLRWIRANWNDLIKNRFSPTTILRLFELMEFRSSFHRNGEYYCLYAEFAEWLPVLHMLFTAESLPEPKAPLSPEDKRIIDSAWKAIHEPCAVC